MVQSKWGSKNVCQVPAMNEALEIQGQVTITPSAQVQNKERVFWFRLRGIGLYKINLFYSKAILEEKPPKYVTFVASEEKKGF